MEKTKGEKRNEYGERVWEAAQELNSLTSKFAALISYMERKMQDRECRCAMRWLYEIIDKVDDDTRDRFPQDDAFLAIHGYDPIDRYDINRSKEIEERLLDKEDEEREWSAARVITEDYRRASATLGEIKCHLLYKYILGE